MSKTERQTYKIAGPATWELIRAAYLAGESAPALAERYGVGVHGIRKRITVEKWTKRDFAQALEARGVKLPEKPKDDFIEEGVVRAAARAAAEERVEAERVADVHAWIEQVAAEEEADVMAGALERRALAQAGAAMVQGKSKEAQALAALAEQMRKRAGVTAPVAAALAAQKEERREVQREGMTEQEGMDYVADFFMKVAYVAHAMLHAPESAPARFIDLIIEWRRRNLGEGEADAKAAAEAVARSRAHFLEGELMPTLPEEVQAYNRRLWAQVVAERTGQIVAVEASAAIPGGDASAP